MFPEAAGHLSNFFIWLFLERGWEGDEILSGRTEEHLKTYVVD